MTPKEIIDAVAQETGLTPEQVRAVLVSEAKVQVAALELGEEVKSLFSSRGVGVKLFRGAGSGRGHGSLGGRFRTAPGWVSGV